MDAPETDEQVRFTRKYTESLGLMAQLKRPPIKLDMVPVLDLLVIALLFSLLFTRFVMVPGVQVDLPDSEIQMQPHDLPVAVLTIGNRGMLFLGGAVFELNSVESGFREHLEKIAGENSVLLVKTEGSMDLQLFLELCRMAKDAGFVQIQIAGETPLDSGAEIPSQKGANGEVNPSFFPVM